MSIFVRHSPLQLLKNWALAGQDCLLCRAAGSAFVCVDCESRLVRCHSTHVTDLVANPAFDEVASRFAYRFPVDRLVQRYKFAGDLAIGRWLASQLARDVSRLPRPDLLVAPPLTRARLRERGFNQALEIARYVGREIGVPWDVGGVAKVRETVPQPALGGRARRRNLRGAFACARSFAGMHVAIVDDVLTTGATADALARELKLAGAARVSVWTVARASGARR